MTRLLITEKRALKGEEIEEGGEQLVFIINHCSYTYTEIEMLGTGAFRSHRDA